MNSQSASLPWSAWGVVPVVQAVLARSFEYYSGIVFKLFIGDERICSGGRYDGLIETIGERSVPASGFAHYLSPIVTRLLPADDRVSNVRVLVEANDLDPACIAATISAARELRKRGFCAESTRRHDLRPTHRLVVDDDGARFRLLAEGSDETFSSLEGVIARLEPGR
jgi:histidyl-tRNA synthetase